MKKSLLKRIGAVALAVAVSLTMGTAAFAVNSDGTLNDDNGISSSDTSIGIAKQIVFVNAEQTDVREPNITYTYTISAVTPTNATITDKSNITGTVKAGVIDAVTNTDKKATVTFADTNTVSATSTGTNSASKYATFNFSNSAFAAPGIYRYKISELTNVTKASVGITETATYSADRYLDVYVQKNADGTAREIYGYVLYEGTADQSITSDDLTGGDVSMKSKGYVNTSTTGQADVDVYTTQNLYIEKTTTGSMADVDNDFPISMTLAAASGVTATPKIDVVLGGNGALTGTASDDVGTYITFATSMAGTVDNGSSIYLKGIPAGATASLVETNNTPDSYKVKAGKTADAADLLAENIVAAGSDSSATTTQTLDAKVSIFITNTLESISPTNVVMRFAPYLFILGAAIVLLVMMRRRKAHNAE